MAMWLLKVKHCVLFPISTFRASVCTGQGDIWTDLSDVKHIHIIIMYKTILYMYITKTNCGCGHTPVVSAPLKFRITARYCNNVNVFGFYLWKHSCQRPTALSIYLVCKVT